MSRQIHIAGDGVAGLMLAAVLARRGAQPVVHGDRRAWTQNYALVHRYAGRSFRTTPLGDAAWAAARPVLEDLVAGGSVQRTMMARPLRSAAGARLLGSLDAARDVRIEEVRGFGECFVYDDAYVVDVASALAEIARCIDLRRGTVEAADVLATGARIEGDHLEQFGGHLVEFEGELGHAVSGGGVHAVPTRRGVCVGSTWWPPGEPQADDDAARELRERATTLGVELGDVLHCWSGERCVNQLDRRPIAGALRGQFVVGALGTRGWFWAPLLAEQAAAALLDGARVMAELDARRVDGPDVAPSRT